MMNVVAFELTFTGFIFQCERLCWGVDRSIKPNEKRDGILFLNCVASYNREEINFGNNFETN